MPKRARGAGLAATLTGDALKILFGAVCVCVGLLLYSVGRNDQSESEQSSKFRSDQYAEENDAGQAGNCAILPAQLQDVCFAKQNEANRKNERDERDLVAQEVTAAWTRVTAFAAIVGVVASIFGLGLIWAAYQATQDTNRITRDLGRKQLRAYLTIDLKAFSIGEYGVPNFDIRVRNLGATPASSVVLKVRVLYRDVSPMHKEGSEKDIQQSGFGIHDIGSGRTGRLDRDLPWLRADAGKFGDDYVRLRYANVYIGVFATDIFDDPVRHMNMFVYRHEADQSITPKTKDPDGFGDLASLEKVEMAGPIILPGPLIAQVPAREDGDDAKDED